MSQSRQTLVSLGKQTERGAATAAKEADDAQSWSAHQISFYARLWFSKTLLSNIWMIFLQVLMFPTDADADASLVGLVFAPQKSPNFLKMSPNFLKMSPNFLKMSPNFLKMSPNSSKCLIISSKCLLISSICLPISSKCLLISENVS